MHTGSTLYLDDEDLYLFRKYQYMKSMPGTTSEQVDSEPADWIEFVLTVENAINERSNNKR